MTLMIVPGKFQQPDQVKQRLGQWWSVRITKLLLGLLDRGMQRM